jgi:hypothetical protein
MSKYFVLLVQAALLAFAQNGTDVLTNETIIKMFQAGVPTATIIKTIAAADKVDFRFVGPDLQRLVVDAKVPDEVFKAMAAKDKGLPISVNTSAAPLRPSTPTQAPVRVKPQKPSTRTDTERQFGVKIIDRQDSQTGYSYVVPGHSNAVSNTDVNCYGGTISVNCSGSTTTSGFSTPPTRVSYDVTGATLSLQLPDGRIAVVNCESKLNWTDYSRMNQVRRSCRIPLVNDIQAEFDGDKPKWLVSIDGKKLESETYKILAVLDK